MQRYQLEHIVRAASGITGAPEFVIIGSQAILGQFPEAPDELLVSIEADLFSLRSQDDSDLVEGCIGEGSPFHQTFGYYAHGVGEDTAILPPGWRSRSETKTRGPALGCVLKSTTSRFQSSLQGGRKTSSSSLG